MNSIIRVLGGAILVITLSSLISAFANDRSKSGRPPYKKLRIGVSLLTLAHPFFFELEKGLQDSASSKGYELLISGAEYDCHRQKEQLESFIIEDVDAIIVNPADRDSIRQVIKAAYRAGIPVFTVDTDCDAAETEVIYHVGTDNYDGGKLAAEVLIEGLINEMKINLKSDGAKVIILIQARMTSSEARVEGFSRRIDEYKTNLGYKINIDSVYTHATREEAYNKMDSVLKKHPDLKGVFAINDEVAIGAFEAIRDAKTKIILVGFDGSKEAQQQIEQYPELFYDSIKQYPYIMGTFMILAIAEYFDGHPPIIGSKDKQLHRYKQKNYIKPERTRTSEDSNSIGNE